MDASPNPPNPTLYQGVKRFFVVHGGLFSKDGVTLDDIRSIPRMSLKQPGQEGLMCEALWADPQDAPGRGPSKRGVGLGFGPDVTRKWTDENEVTAVIRAHEVRQGGYSVEHDGRLITVFSAPNYVRLLRCALTLAVADASFALLDDPLPLPRPSELAASRRLTRLATSPRLSASTRRAR